VKSEALEAAFQAIVPSAKGIAWIITAGAAMFMAGVGATLRTSDYAQLPMEMDDVQVQVSANRTTLEIVQREVEDTQKGLVRIRCLTRLSATGQVVDPLEIDLVCP
tara:strand:+ start:471 stop:788 length:318 start_codon:yes stop_codon:yes gene_type:complete